MNWDIQFMCFTFKNFKDSLQSRWSDRHDRYLGFQASDSEMQFVTLT